jgi:hypothetical protein
MSFDLPNLDVLPAEVVLDQLVRRIPSYAPGWTDHNPSDPGITLLQMLVWLREGTAYTANAVPRETYRNMLRWVAGLSSALALPHLSGYDKAFPYAKYADTNSQDPSYELLKQMLVQMELDSTIGYAPLQSAVAEFRRAPFLAVTPADLKELASEVSGFIDAQKDTNALHVARLCLQQRGDITTLVLVDDAAYDYSPPEATKIETSGVLLTSSLDKPKTTDDEAKLLDRVREYLTARMLLGAAMAIENARLIYVQVQCEVYCFAREPADEVAAAVLSALQQALQPVRTDGGRDWAYGTPIDAAMILPVIAAVPGVDSVAKLDITFGHPFLVHGHRRPPLPGGEGLPRLYRASVTALEPESD